MTDEAPLDEPLITPFVDTGPEGLRARLDAAEVRLAQQAALGLPAGTTDPEAETGERWEAGQVWAHVAEFVPYWHDELERVIGQYDGEPVPFGRVKSDAGRVAAIEAGRSENPERQMERISDAIERLQRFLDGLGLAEWSAEGRHQTRGVMDTEHIVEHFLVRHIEEHAEQLERLREAAA